MRKTKQLLVLAAILLGLATPGWADNTTYLTSNNGWTKITSLPSSLSDYYFVIVDNTSDFMVGLTSSTSQMTYLTSSDPLNDTNLAWIIEEDNGTYYLKNVKYETYMYSSTEGGPWDCYAKVSSKSAIGFEYSSDNSYWTLKNAGAGDYYLGSWNKKTSGTDLASGEVLAGNRSSSELSATLGSFQIYQISRTTFDASAATFYGTYFLQDTDKETYISRGYSWRTRAICDDYGIGFNMYKLSDGTYTLQYVDNEKYVFDASGQTVYGDAVSCTNGKWTLEEADGGYYIKNSNNNGSQNSYLYNNGTCIESSNTNKTVWALVEPATRNSNIAQKHSDSNTAVLTEAGTTEDALSTDFAGTKTDILTDISESYQGTSTSFDENSTETALYSNEITDLDEGLYKVHVDAFFRFASNAIVENAAVSNTAAARAFVQVASGDNTYKNLLTSPFDVTASYTTNGGTYTYNDTAIPNDKTSAADAMTAGNYGQDFYVNVGSDKKITISLYVPAYVDAQWLCYNNISYTKYSQNIADEDDYEALNTAIAAAEKKTLGFEEGEYAPYNHVAALEALAKANEIDQTVNNSKSVVNELTETLNNATWTANKEEVNAIYDGTFGEYDYKEDGTQEQPIGWTGDDSHNTANCVRHMYGTSSNAGLTATSSEEAMMIKFGANYGMTTGYTMPLKANTTYSLSFLYGGWNENHGPRTITITCGDASATITPASVTAPNNTAHSTASSWAQYVGFFTTDKAGDYVLTFSTPSQQNQLAIGDISIYKAQTITRESSYKNGTICYPYALTPGENTAIYEIKGRSSDSKTIYFTDEVTETEAGKPYIYEVSKANDEGKYVATFNYSPATKVESEVDGANQLKGTFTKTTALSNCTSGKSAYIVQKGKWVLVPENYWGTYNMTANTAYIADMDAVTEATSDGSSAGAKSMTVDIDGTTTGIDGITLDSKNGDIYNLNGQKVSRAHKGVYIQNGQKRVIK